VTNVFSIPITANLILVLSGLAFLIFCMAIWWTSLRIVQRTSPLLAGGSAALIFLSSPFMVSSANLMGYYDNIVISLGILSIFLLIKGRSWPASLLQAVALLIHENALFLSLGPFLLALLLIWRSGRHGQYRWPDLARSLRPLLLPVCVFLLLLISQEWFLKEDFAEQFSGRLSQFAFIQNDRSTLGPLWITTSFSDYFPTESKYFLSRLISQAMLLALPSTLAILLLLVRGYQVRTDRQAFAVLIALCFAPQLMHLVAWDIDRIWTYTILCAYLCLWIYAELRTVQKGTQVNTRLYLGIILVHAIAATPLLDEEVDHFSLFTRLLLYLPVIVAVSFLKRKGETL
jgi:hypothetical protein